MLVLYLEFVVLSTIIFATKTTVSVVPTVNGWESGRGFTGLYTGPYFDTTTPTNITTQLGTHAFLPCKIRQLGNKSVSWIRTRDSHILTVDRYTFIADERFQVLHNADAWTLQIKYIQPRDAGIYECQVTSEPKLSQFISIDVIVPQTKILGESDVFVKSGSTVQIKCVITQNLEQPSYIFWYHDAERVEMNDGKYSWVDRVNSNTTIGTLVIKSTVVRDSGNYTCSPSNIESASVMLHILNGEHPAAMQQESTASKLILPSTSTYCFIYIIVLIVGFGLLSNCSNEDSGGGTTTTSASPTLNKAISNTNKYMTARMNNRLSSSCNNACSFQTNNNNSNNYNNIPSNNYCKISSNSNSNIHSTILNLSSFPFIKIR